MVCHVAAMSRVSGDLPRLDCDEHPWCGSEQHPFAMEEDELRRPAMSCAVQCWAAMIRG